MKRDKIRSIVYDAMFLAIFVVFTFVPYLGYITIGPVSFTYIHLFVILGAALFGWKRGLLYGFFMGIFSLIKAVQFPGTADYFFLNPFISVFPRMIFGLASGLLFDRLKKIKFINQARFNRLLIPTSIFCSFFHTFIVVIMWYLFGILDPFKISATLGLSAIIQDMTFQAFIFSFLIWGSLIEITIAGVIIPPIYALIVKLFKIGGVKEKEVNKIETKAAWFTFFKNFVRFFLLILLFNEL